MITSRPYFRFDWSFYCLWEISILSLGEFSVVPREDPGAQSQYFLTVTPELVPVSGDHRQYADVFSPAQTCVTGYDSRAMIFWDDQGYVTGNMPGGQEDFKAVRQ